MNAIHLIVSVFCLRVLAISYDPILYAVDVGDGNGLILLKKWSLRCPQYYKSVRETDLLILRFSSGQWEITQGPNYYVGNSGCSQTNGTGTQLFTHEGEDMSNGSWVNVQKDTKATNFNVYALEDCTTYEGAFIYGDFKSGEIIMDSSLCQNTAQATGRIWEPIDVVSVNLFTTTTSEREELEFRDGIRTPVKKVEIWCKFRNVGFLTKAVLKLTKTDENARVMVRGKNCYGGVTGRSAKVMNINEALLPTHFDSSDLISRSNFDTSNVNETETSIYWVIFGAGAALVAIVVLIIYFVNKNKEPQEKDVKKHTENNSKNIILKKGKDLGRKINLVAENEDKIKKDFQNVEGETEGSQKRPTHNAKLIRNEEHNRSDVVPYDSNMVTIGKKLGINSINI